MTDEQCRPDLAEQQAIVLRYALQLRRAAGGARRPADQNIRRCYELLNQCAMELAELDRRPGNDPAAVN
jgi:hypothetical protein